MKDMTDTVKMIGMITLTAVIFGWVLRNASAAEGVTKAAASSYATAVGAIIPQQAA